ncbi:vWA domain-containing protein [Aliarcobacter lanthieri]|uniref:vWA domain-containing protein n=1 Tax=Aliarcobacter lanthieri TaxID=1355374 RepID=UPI00047B3E3E|nr:vWA domain-containing protein [Aliarcobacter lanthieri]
MSISNPEINIKDKTAIITIDDDKDLVDVTISATITTPKIIDVNTKTDGTKGIKITAIGSNGKAAELSVIKGTDHDGFGVETKDKKGKSINLSNGDTKELGYGEKIIVEFTDGKEVNSIDVAFAWRNNHETARVTFIKDGKVIGYAEVTGDGQSTTKAFVTYYTPEGEVIKVVNAKGSSDKVDELFTFELPSKNGGIESFDKIEFTAPTTVDDYLINKIVYREVVNTDITDIVTQGGEITFDIQTDEKYPPQGKATAIVEVNGKLYTVELNATGRGYLTIDAKDLSDLSKVNVKVISIDGGNYEGINTNGSNKEFDFTASANGEKLESSNDNIVVTEDTAYILKVTDFGNLSPITKELKITNLPENGKLYLIVTKGETIFNKDGSQTVAIEDTKLEITKDQVISLADIGAGKVVFEPNENSDDDGSFKFKVGDGKGNFSEEYITEIEIKAVADLPDVSIDIREVRTYIENINQESNNSSNGKVIDLGDNHIGTSTSWDNGVGLYDDANIKVTSSKNGTIMTGFGNDIISVGNMTGSINGGLGYDTLKLSGNKSDYSITIQNNGNMISYEEWKEYNDKNPDNGISYIFKNVITEENFTIANIENIIFGDSNIETPITIVEYEIDISASLTDRDGSETLEVIIKGIPVSSEITSDKYEIFKNEDGSYTVKVPEGVIDVKDTLTMKTPIGYTKNIKLEIEAKATEKRDNEDGQNFKTSTASDSLLDVIDESSNITLNKEESNINLILTLDVSGSMVRTNNGGSFEPVDLDGKGTTRFDIVKQSMISTIETYKATGNTMVNLTLFGSNAKNIGWMSADDALNYLNKLTMGYDSKVRYEGKELGINSGNTNYKVAIEETKKINILASGQSDAKTIGYFISDGEPNQEISSIDEDSDKVIQQWKTFVDKNRIDLKVIGVGTAQDNESALKYLKIVQVISGDEIIVINEPASIETIILGTVEGTVFGDISDNFSGGDGKITIDNIIVDGQEYTKDTIPKGGIKLDGEGKLIFDFETGKYAYNGNGIDITENKTKSFIVNISDEDGDKNSININFELSTQRLDGIINFNEAGEINFSNLKNITEINLDNGKENKLSLTLDDVIKLSGDDNTIKISGDIFDKVEFKNEDGKVWEKQQSITDGDKTFDVYSGIIGDQTVHVKVEQPISDGITN